MEEKTYTFRVEEYYTGRFREKAIPLSDAEVDALIRFLREVEQEPDIYNSVLEKSCPALYHKLDDAAEPLMDELEKEMVQEQRQGFYKAWIPDEIVTVAFESGLSHTSTLVVTEADTARAMGSGSLPVLATPRLAALLENAAYAAVAPILDDGDTTVGGEICLRHLAPSPVGAEVTATAVLERTEGRKFCFSLKAYQGETLIGEGTHTRFVVNTGRFLQKLK